MSKPIAERNTVPILSRKMSPAVFVFFAVSFPPAFAAPAASATKFLLMLDLIPRWNFVVVRRPSLAPVVNNLVLFVARPERWTDLGVWNVLLVDAQVLDERTMFREANLIEFIMCKIDIFEFWISVMIG
jgi:hypothetical protein